MPGEIECAELDEHEWPVARRLIAGAFIDEPFVRGMFGDDPVDRFLGMFGLHEERPSAQGELVLGARSNGVLLAVATVTLPGRCVYCDRWTDDVPSGLTGVALVDHQFRLGVREGHLAAGLPAHAHITTVAAEASLRGGGVGAVLMSDLCRRLVADGPVTAVLEAYDSRCRFYERFGFRRIGEVPEAAVPGLMVGLMRAELV